MKTILRALKMPSIAGTLLLSGTLLSISVGSSRGAEGVAIAIVYDTSGSMQQKVRDADGQMAPKYVIARRTLNSVLDRLEAAAGTSKSGTPTTIHAGLVVFQGDHSVTAIKCGPFQPRAFRDWLERYGQPKRGTPLGDAVERAGQMVLSSGLSRKHVLVITDGINTEGPDPTKTLPKVQKAAAGQNANVSYHFVAFDVNAAEFAGVKALGATVVGAADEKQLSSQLEFIVAKKILLEEEEVTKPKTN